LCCRVRARPSLQAGIRGARLLHRFTLLGLITSLAVANVDAQEPTTGISLEVIREIEIRGDVLVGETTALDVARNGDILLTDVIGRVVLLLDSTGAVIETLDATPCDPGFVMSRWCLVCRPGAHSVEE